MSYIDEALSKIRANSGQNVYNLNVQRGSLGIGRQRERAIQVAEDTLRADPNLLQQTILKIANQSGQQSEDLSLGATDAGVRADANNANALIGIQKYQDELAAAKKARSDALWSAVGGGLLTAVGGVVGAAIGAKGVVDAAKAYSDKPNVAPPDLSALMKPTTDIQTPITPGFKPENMLRFNSVNQPEGAPSLPSGADFHYEYDPNTRAWVKTPNGDFQNMGIRIRGY